ncbi:unnamed protein product [Nezara viridula]|uniref:Uncharacterized protein n=1 Tax=Nezara viridula TaxID=85310 RepID=A0A9P0MNX1_NEZVI|nr:unnamed protein product [Nezara viridula]
MINEAISIPRKTKQKRPALNGARSHGDFAISKQASPPSGLAGILGPTHGKIPWKQIFRSMKFRVIVWANFGFDWGFYIVSLELPFYLFHVLHLPIMKVNL